MSVESRSARDILNEIRGVINHLKQKDRTLNDELTILRSVNSGTDEEQKQKALAEITRLSGENTKLQQQYLDCRQLWNQNNAENTVLKNNIKTLNDEIAEKDKVMDALKREVTFHKDNLKNLEQDYQKLKQNFDNTFKELEVTKSDLQSYIDVDGQLQQEINNLKHKNSELEKTIKSLEIAAKSDDQNQLKQEYNKVIGQLQKLREDSKLIEETSNHNLKAASQYQKLYEEMTQEYVMLKRQIASFRSGEGAAARPVLTPVLPAVLSPQHVQKPVDDNSEIKQVNEDQSAGVDPDADNNVSSGTPQNSGFLKNVFDGTRRIARFVGLGSSEANSSEGNTGAETPAPTIPPAAYQVPVAITNNHKDDSAASPAVTSTGGGGGEAAASSNIPPQPAATGAEFDESRILNVNILNDSNKVQKFFTELGLKMPTNGKFSTMKYVQNILNSAQYKPLLQDTAEYYRINDPMSDDEKIEQIWKFFSEYQRLRSASKKDFKKVTQELNLKQLSQEDCIDKFHTYEPKQRANFSFKLFQELNMDLLKELYKQAGFKYTQQRKHDIIEALIEKLG